MINLKPDDYIGNSLSSININFNELEYWTSNILLSSEKYYDPLVNFYKNYGDFWKSSINFSQSINAAERLTSFSTLVKTNSAKFINPISIIYPSVIKYNINNLQQNINNVINWFKLKYPVENSTSKTVNFPENSVAYLYVMFYNEVERINGNIKVQKFVGCSTNDVSVNIRCNVKYQGNVSCGASSNVCGAIETVCSDVKNASCSYTNNSKTETRSGTLNADRYFKDRYEEDNLYVIVLNVVGCEWKWTERFL